MGLVFASVNLILVLFLAVIIKKYLFYGRQETAYPPGPPLKPLIGNMFDFPASDAASEFQKWGKIYNSDIVHAAALGSHLVILNKYEDADELLEKRATNYSDRPYIPILKLTGWDYNMGFLHYGNEWRYQRKISQEHLGPRALSNTYVVINEKVRNLLDGLLHSPEKFLYHNKMLSISIPMKTMYGYDVESVEDPLIAKAESSTVQTAKLLAPGASLINAIPILRYVPAWFPGFSSRKIAAEIKNLVSEMQDATTKFVEKQVAEGTAFPSLVSDFFEKKNTVGATSEEEKAIKNIALTMYSGASDTTVASGAAFFYLMAAHPEIQKKAQAEMDRVLGPTCLPDFKDRESLPYVEAIYRELLRWLPPGPLGMPHAVMEDDYYKGYLIPKGATVYANIWAMNHDETVYPEPSVFRPERYIDASGNLTDDRILAYGFGRRICVGKHVASATMWLAIACILASFDIGKAKDEWGNDIEINDEFDKSGLMTHKKPFKCSIEPRSPAWRKLIEEFKRGN